MVTAAARLLVAVVHWTSGEPVIQLINAALLAKPTRRMSPTEITAHVARCVDGARVKILVPEEGAPT